MNNDKCRFFKYKNQPCPTKMTLGQKFILLQKGQTKISSKWRLQLLVQTYKQISSKCCLFIVLTRSFFSEDPLESLEGIYLERSTYSLQH